MPEVPQHIYITTQVRTAASHPVKFAIRQFFRLFRTIVWLLYKITCNIDLITQSLEGIYTYVPTVFRVQRPAVPSSSFVNKGRVSVLLHRIEGAAAATEEATVAVPRRSAPLVAERGVRYTYYRRRRVGRRMCSGCDLTRLEDRAGRNG